LRLLALSRIYLDNFSNVQVSWLTVGLKVGQVGLRFGVNDMGSIMIEENVISAAGARIAQTIPNFAESFKTQVSFLANARRSTRLCKLGFS